MKIPLNTNSLIAWLSDVSSEFEIYKIRIIHAENAWQLFDEFCLTKISERNEFRFWEEKAKTNLQQFLAGRPSCFDHLRKTPQD